MGTNKRPPMPYAMWAKQPTHIARRASPPPPPATVSSIKSQETGSEMIENSEIKNDAGCCGLPWWMLFIATMCLVSFADTAANGDEPKIKAVPIAGRLLAVGQVQTIAGSEFEFFNLTGYEGVVTWDVKLPDGTGDPAKLPVKFFEVTKDQPIIGIKVGTEIPDVHLAPDGQSVAIFAVGTGRVTIEAWGSRENRAFKIASLIIQASRGPRPPPQPPVPDVDPPAPDVDPPMPDIDPPGPITGLRALIVYESGDALSREQLNILNSTQIRAYLNEKCVKNDKGHPEWRRWDKSSVETTGLEGESPVLKQLWADVKDKLTPLPKLVIASDTSAKVYDFPATEAETLALIKKVVEGK